MTEEQYNELAQFWSEFMMLGPTKEQKQLNLRGLAWDFLGWIDNDGSEPHYSVEDIQAFFAEKERREGTAVNEW